MVSPHEWAIYLCLFSADVLQHEVFFGGCILLLSFFFMVYFPQFFSDYLESTTIRFTSSHISYRHDAVAWAQVTVEGLFVEVCGHGFSMGVNN